jgi:hypothetical protein
MTRAVENGTRVDEPRPRFSDEEWFSPMKIARKLGYATDKPVRKAIRRGELRAIQAPCGRRLIVAESELLRWLHQLRYEPPATRGSSAPVERAPQSGVPARRRQLPTLNYDATRTARR